MYFLLTLIIRLLCETNEHGKLELFSFYSSPYEGKEGSFDALLEEYKEMHPEDQEWFQQIADNINRSDELPDLDEVMSSQNLLLAKKVYLKELHNHSMKLLVRWLISY